MTGQPVEGRKIADVSWFAPSGKPLDWAQDELAMMAYIAAPSRADDPDGLGRDLILMFNSTGQTRDYQMPGVGRGMKWNLFVDTAAESPGDIYPESNGPMPPSTRIVEMPHHSMKVYVGGAITT